MVDIRSLFTLASFREVYLFFFLGHLLVGQITFTTKCFGHSVTDIL